VTSDRADALADLVLLDHEGGEVRLGDLWSKRPVALVWLRHYGDCTAATTRCSCIALARSSRPRAALRAAAAENRRR
jgi:hypothetical protein